MRFMEDGLVDIAYRTNGAEKELTSRGFYPYRHGEIVDLSHASDLEIRNYSDSDSDGISKKTRIVRRRQGEKLNPNASHYLRFLREVDGIDVSLENLSRETMERLLRGYFPKKFASVTSRNLSEESCDKIKGTFNGIVNYARNQRRLLQSK